GIEDWHVLQRWLKQSAEHRVCIPYAKKLVTLIPPVAVRLRRDNGALMGLIATHAMLHQASRDRDTAGRIIATRDDYAAIYELIVDLMSEGVGASVSATTRETVEAVKKLGKRERGCSITDIGKELGSDKTTA